MLFGHPILTHFRCTNTICIHWFLWQSKIYHEYGCVLFKVFHHVTRNTWWHVIVFFRIELHICSKLLEVINIIWPSRFAVICYTYQSCQQNDGHWRRALSSASSLSSHGSVTGSVNYMSGAVVTDILQSQYCVIVIPSLCMRDSLFPSFKFK